MGILSDFVGARELEIEFPENTTFKELLNKFKEDYVKKFPNQFFQGEQFRYLHLMINLQDVDEKKDANRQLSDGDTFYVIPPVGGG